MAHRLASFIAVLATLFALPAGAADLKVISAGAVRGLIAQIIEDYSLKTGQKFDFTIGTTGQLRTVITSGQPADLIIVSQNIFEIDPHKIKDTKVVLTMVGGRVVYRANSR